MIMFQTFTNNHNCVKICVHQKYKNSVLCENDVIFSGNLSFTCSMIMLKDMIFADFSYGNYTVKE